MILTAKVEDRRFLAAIGDDPVGPRELAGEVGVTYRSALARLYELEARGLVRAGTSIGGVGTSSGQSWHLTDAGREALGGGG